MDEPRHTVPWLPGGEISGLVFAVVHATVLVAAALGPTSMRKIAEAVAAQVGVSILEALGAVSVAHELGLLEHDPASIHSLPPSRP